MLPAILQYESQKFWNKIEKSYLFETLEIINSRLKLEHSISVNGDTDGCSGRESYLSNN